MRCLLSFFALTPGDQLALMPLMKDAAEISTYLASRVMGQPNAIFTLAAAVARHELRKPGKPRGAFLFAGATGVGKTELAKALADFIHQESKGGTTDHFRRFAMSEYQDEQAFSRLMNSGGHCGHGRLPEAIEELNRAGGGVLLLDEIEKAPAFRKAFLELLDEGRITDGAGFVHRLGWVWVVMTTNLGGAEAAQLGMNGAPDVTVERVVHSAAAEWFGPEGLARFDSVVVFRGLSDAVQRQLAGREVALEHERIVGQIDRHLQRHCRYTLPVLPPGQDIVNYLCVQGINKLLGARNLKRTIETMFADAVVAFVHAIVTRTVDPAEMIAGSAFLTWTLEDRQVTAPGVSRRRLMLKPIYPDTASKIVPMYALSALPSEAPVTLAIAA